MNGVRETIIRDLVADLNGIQDIGLATEYVMNLTNADDRSPYVAVSVESETPTVPGSSRYKASLDLWITTEQDFNGIESLIEDIKDYIKTASITNVLELTYVGHEPVAKEQFDDNRFSSTRLNISLLYKDTNTDTVVNTTPATARVGYMSISHGKVYDLMVASGSAIQSAGTNVYDSHSNANLEIPTGSGSLTVDIVDSNVLPDIPGLSSTDVCDLNEIALSIRGHFAEGTANTVIMPMMYNVVNEIRTNIDLGDYYRLYTDEPFSIIYDQDFEESGTRGSELTFNVRRYWEYTQ